MPSSVTRVVMARLRQVQTLAAQRALDAARAALERAQRALDLATKDHARQAGALAALESTQLQRGRAGELARRHASLAAARERTRASALAQSAAEAEVARAEEALDHACRAVEQSARAAERGRELETVEARSRSRADARRDQAAAEERWRPPRR